MKDILASIVAVAQNTGRMGAALSPQLPNVPIAKDDVPMELVCKRCETSLGF